MATTIPNTAALLNLANVSESLQSMSPKNSKEDQEINEPSFSSSMMQSENFEPLLSLPSNGMEVDAVNESEQHLFHLDVDNAVQTSTHSSFVSGDVDAVPFEAEPILMQSSSSMETLALENSSSSNSKSNSNSNAKNQKWDSAFLNDNKQYDPNGLEKLKKLMEDETEMARLKKCAEEEQPEALVDLASCYRFGIIIKVDWKLDAHKLLIKAAKKNCPLADWILFEYYKKNTSLLSDTVKRNILNSDQRYKLAFEFLEKAANANLAVAQYDLGGMFEKRNSRYLPKDIRSKKGRNVLVFKWYKRAADLGHPEAQYDLGCCYEENFGVPENEIHERLEKAKHYFGLAEKNGVKPVEKIKRIRYNKQDSLSIARRNKDIQKRKEKSKNSSKSSEGITINLADDDSDFSDSSSHSNGNSSENSDNAHSNKSQPMELPKLPNLSPVNSPIKSSNNNSNSSNNSNASNSSNSNSSSKMDMASSSDKMEISGNKEINLQMLLEQFVTYTQNTNQINIEISQQQNAIDKQQIQLDFLFKCINKQTNQLQETEKMNLSSKQKLSTLENSLKDSPMMGDLPFVNPTNESNSKTSESKKEYEQKLAASLKSEIEFQKSQLEIIKELKLLIETRSKAQVFEIKKIKEISENFNKILLIEQQEMNATESNIKRINNYKASIDEAMQDLTADRTFAPFYNGVQNSSQIDLKRKRDEISANNNSAVSSSDENTAKRQKTDHTAKI